MKKAIADKWIQALRSGEFKQGQEALKNEYGQYCCLGVLCEVKKVPVTGTDVVGKTFFGGDSGYFPEVYLSSASLKAATGHFEASKVKWPRSIPKRLRENESLANLNDNGATFKQIAAFIELNYKLL